MPEEARLVAVAEIFEEAALGNSDWEKAVERFNAAFNLRAGQLVAFGRQGLVFAAMPGIEPMTPEDVAIINDPSVNSRIRIGTDVPELQLIDERSFTTLEDMRATPEYADWMNRNEIGYSAVTPLLKEGGTLVGLAAFRGRSQDEFVGDEKRAFSAVAARIRSAVNLAIALEHGHAKSLVAGLEGLATAALVCNPQGMIVSASVEAERLLAGGRFGRIAEGAFVPLRPHDRDQFSKALAQAIMARLGIGAPPPRPVVLTASDGERLVVEFIPLAQKSVFAFASAVMMVFRTGAGRADRLAEIAGELFELTPTERRVAAQLLEGRSPAMIADHVGTSVGTVRNHVHRILSKSGCGSQTEFLALINRFS